MDGIGRVTPEDITFAREFGYRIKLLGVARAGPDGIDQRVHPAMVKLGTPLADVDGAFNAVVADAGQAGPFFFAGRGAGESSNEPEDEGELESLGIPLAAGHAPGVWGTERSPAPFCV